MSNRSRHRGDEEDESLSAQLHYRDGKTMPMRIPALRPDAILYEGFVAGDAKWQPGEAPEQARPIAVLFRRDPHKDQRDVDLHSSYPIGETMQLTREPDYEQDSRWPRRGYARSRRRCSTCKPDKQWYFVRSLWANETPSDATIAECDDCYRKHYGAWGEE